MKRVNNNRSHCPVNFALEAFGDSWSLLIVRDIIFWGRHSYGEFLAAEEGIATNILATRLSHLVESGILAKSPHPTDRRKEVYALTEKGIDLIPVVLEMTVWGAIYDAQTIAPRIFVDALLDERKDRYRKIQDLVRAGGSLFVGKKRFIDLDTKTLC